MQRSNTVLLTATIVPPAGVPGLAQADPVIRLKQYADALEYYASMPVDMVGRIVFAENSGADLSSLKRLTEKQGDRVRFISWSGLDHPPACGRGFGEFKLVDHVLARPEAVGGLPANESIWKVTGRYRVLNLTRLMHTAPQRFEVYCDLKNRPMPWVDLRVFAFTLGGYDRHLRGVYPQLREDVNRVSPEVVLREKLGKELRSVAIVPRLRVEPRIDGVRGMDGRSYLDRKGMLKHRVRAISRRATPWLWI